MNEVQVFNNLPSRTVQIDGETWWVVKDVCKIIGIKYYRSALRKIDETQKGVTIIHTPGGDQEMSIVNLQGLNRLIMKAKTEIALQYQDWVMDKVVKSVVETGSYSVASVPNPLDNGLLMAKMIELMEKMEARMSILEKRPQLAIGEKSEYVEPEVEVIEYSYRMKVRDVINKYIKTHPGEYSHAWRHLYDHFNKRYRFNAIRLSEDRKIAGEDLSPLDMVENAGRCQDLYNLALDLYPMLKTQDEFREHGKRN